MKEFTNLFSKQITLRNELKPVGRTLEYIEMRGLIGTDEHRAESYKIVKNVIDEYHRNFIEKTLKDVELSGVEEFAELYSKTNKNDKEKLLLEKKKEELRKQVIQFMISNEEFNSLWKKDFVEKKLVEYTCDDSEKINAVKEFKGFTTYFAGFNENRRNMYSDEEKATSIGYRVVDQNLPKYIDNVAAIKKAIEINPEGMVEAIEKNFEAVLKGMSLKEFFAIDNYSYFITQSGIDSYNNIIGGYTLDEKTKIKGINEYINLYNQKEAVRLGRIKPLFKQILSEKSSLSFLPTMFEDDNELLRAIFIFSEEAKLTLSGIKSMLRNYAIYTEEKVYIKSTALKTISNSLFSNWSYIQNMLEDEYDEKYSGKVRQGTKKYDEVKAQVFKGKKSYSVYKINKVVNRNILEDYFSGPELVSIADKIDKTYSDIEEIINTDYPKDRNLIKDEKTIEKIKAYLDALKELQRFIQPLLGNGDEGEKDAVFYGEFTPLWEQLDSLTPLYNKVRNYVTRKPYSIEKIKLNFENSTLLKGWDLNKEEDNTCVILLKDDKYYLGIMNKKDNKIFRNIEEAKTGPCYRKMEYKLLPGANKMLPKVFFAKSNIDYYGPSEEIVRKYNAGAHKKGDNFNINDCHKIIDFFKASIEKHEDWSKFGFDFSDTKKYEDISKFYREVEQQGYTIKFKNIAEDTIDRFVEEGKLYLFEIYNKDFSKFSKGTPNLHTLYFKMLFDERNLKDVVYKINGEAEVFYRKASISEKDMVVHEAYKPIKNKNPLNDKPESIYKYDIIKDKRFTVDKFQFHLPITMNFKSIGGDNINLYAREYIKEQKNIHIIGIDRGERHLLYISVIDMDGKIVDQYSLNKIINEYKGEEKINNYKELLQKREEERDKARKDWKTVENIKELKEGYLSQVIHKIAELVIKYNGIVVLEDLNAGFKNSRKKVEKQVYQKFEKMLIEKFNYLVDKKMEVDNPGGLLNALQLTSKFKSFNELGKQSGILFYVPAWNTSKIDPVTGFTNLFDGRDLRYSSVDASKGFWSKFKSICYKDDEGLFEFSFDYGDFTTRAEGTRTDWKVYSYGNRIVNFRNQEKNSQWDSKEIDITSELRMLFEQYGIKYDEGDIIDEICSISEKSFHESLINLFKLVLQMRNSAVGTEIDYMISPVKDENGRFFCSGEDKFLPLDADANGAYNIARKGLMIVDRIKVTPTEDMKKIKLSITNKDWLYFAQKKRNL